MPEINPSKINALIIDDELSGRTMIEYYLREFANDVFEDITAVSSLKEALVCLKNLKVDVIFTDYELRNETGLMIQPHVSEDIPIIVVSAHSQYAVQAIQTSVFDYLLKPLSEAEILRFKDRLKKKLKFQQEQKNAPKIEQHLIIKDSGENIVVSFQDILFIEASGAYSKIVTNSKTFIASKTLKSIEVQLPKSFIRIHRSYIVPLNQIASYTSNVVCLKNGAQIALSKTGRKLFQSYF